jgi:hypothetical protein
MRSRRIRLVNRPRGKPGGGMSGMGEVAALIVGVDPRRTRKQMGDMGDGGGLIDQLAGTTLGQILEKLDQVSLALKISTAAAIGGALVALVAAVLRRK